MTDDERLRYLKLALRIVGIIAIFGLYPLTVFWPSGWSWSSVRSEYLEMIIAIYATLGIFLLLASRNPNQHLSLISFAIWSSIAHGAVMAVQSRSIQCTSIICTATCRRYSSLRPRSRGYRQRRFVCPSPDMRPDASFKRAPPGVASPSPAGPLNSVR